MQRVSQSCIRIINQLTPAFSLFTIIDFYLTIEEQISVTTLNTLKVTLKTKTIKSAIHPYAQIKK